MKIHRGNTIESAIKLNLPQGSFISNLDQKIDENLELMFGKNDGDYFVYNAEIRNTPSGKKLKILSIEDKDGDKHSIIFELITPKKSDIFY